jgi:hypothetical protein
MGGVRQSRLPTFDVQALQRVAVAEGPVAAALNAGNSLDAKVGVVAGCVPYQRRQGGKSTPSTAVAKIAVKRESMSVLPFVVGGPYRSFANHLLTNGAGLTVFRGTRRYHDKP